MQDSLKVNELNFILSDEHIWLIRFDAKLTLPFIKGLKKIMFSFMGN